MDLIDILSEYEDKSKPKTEAMMEYSIAEEDPMEENSEVIETSALNSARP
jgi:hypothetical protein